MCPGICVNGGEGVSPKHSSSIFHVGFGLNNNSHSITTSASVIPRALYIIPEGNRGSSGAL